MTSVVLVFVAGGVGCVLRYGLTAVGKRWFDVFPAGTLVANVVGCFVFGVLAHWMLDREGGFGAEKTAVLVGLLGGFTTFSSFGYDTVSLWESGRVGLAAGNVALNNVLGLGAAWGGLALARAVGWGGAG